MDLRLKESIEIYRKADLRVFTSPGLAISVGLILIFALLNLIPVNFPFFGLFTVKIPGNLVWFLLTTVLAVIGAFFTMSIWYFLVVGTRLGPKLGALIVGNPILKALLLKGDQAYFEKLGESERKIGAPIVIGKLIALIIAWLSIVAFFISFFLQYLDILWLPPIDYVTAGSDLTSIRAQKLFDADLTNPAAYLVKVLIVLFLSPVVLSIVVPLPWMLIDSNLKSYASGPRINNFVGRIVGQRISSVFFFAGLVSVISIVPATSLLPFLVSMIVFVLLFIALPASIVVFLYHILFNVQYYNVFVDLIPVPFGLTRVDMQAKSAKMTTSSTKEPPSNAQKPAAQVEQLPKNE